MGKPFPLVPERRAARRQAIMHSGFYESFDWERKRQG